MIVETPRFRKILYPSSPVPIEFIEATNSGYNTRGANLEEAEIVVRCRRPIRGVRGVVKAGFEGPHRPPLAAILSQIFVLSK